MKRLIKSLLAATVLTVMVLAMGVMVSAADQTPEKVTGVKQTNATNYSVNFSWDAQLMDCQYDTQISEDGQNWYYVDEEYYTSGTTEYVNKLSAGKTYYVRVRGAIKTSTNDVLGPWSDTVAVVTKPLDLKDLYQTNATTDSITLGWSKVEGATAYQVYEYVNGEYILKGETADTSYTISGLKNTETLPAIRVNPIRSAGTYKAIGNGKMLYSSSLRLVSDKVKNVNIKYFWTSFNEINFAFDASLYSDGYEYQVYDIKGKKPVSTGLTSSYYSTTVKNIKFNRFYKLRVRSYVNVNGKKLYGAWSDFTGFAFQPKVTIKASGKMVLNCHGKR